MSIFMRPGRTARAAAAGVLACGVLAGCGSPGDEASTSPALAATPPVAVAQVKDGGWFRMVSDPVRNRVYETWSTSRGDELRTYVAASLDGGATFAPPVWIARDREAHMPAVRVDGTGRLWVAWTHFDLDPKHLLNPADEYSNPAWQRLAWSDDGGRTFSEPVDLPAFHAGRPASAFGTLSVSDDGKTVSVEWLDYLPLWDTRVPVVGRDAAQVVASTSTDGGRTFAAPVRVSRTGCVCCQPYGLAVGGRTALLFRGWVKGGSDGDVRDMRLSVRGDAGAWTGPVAVHADGFRLHHCPSVGPAGVEDAQGVLHVAWWTGAKDRAGYWYATSTDGGRTFGAPVEVERHPSAPNENNATVALAPDGTPWTATVTHGLYGDDGNEDPSPNRVHVFTLAGGTPRRVPEAEAEGSSPQLGALEDGLVLTWVRDGRLFARRITS